MAFGGHTLTMHGGLHGVWQYWGRTLLSSSSATWQQLFGQDKHRWAFVGYLVHLFFNRQRFRADDFQIPQHRQALFVGCYTVGQLLHTNK